MVYSLVDHVPRASKKRKSTHELEAELARVIRDIQEIERQVKQWNRVKLG